MLSIITTCSYVLLIRVYRLDSNQPLGWKLDPIPVIFLIKIKMEIELDEQCTSLVIVIYSQDLYTVW